MNPIIKKLGRQSKGNLDSYIDKYVDDYLLVMEAIQDTSVLKAHINSENLLRSMDSLKLSLIFNELTLFSYCNYDHKVASKMIHDYDDWYEKNTYDGEVKIAGSSEVFEKEGIIDGDLSGIRAGFDIPKDKAFLQLIEELSPFLESGNLLLQPSRNLYWESPEIEVVGGKDSLFGCDSTTMMFNIEVAQYSDPGMWIMTEDWAGNEAAETRPPLLTFQSNDHLDQKIIFDICTPYIKGISLKDLFKLNQDEGDTVASLRKGISTSISEIQSGANPLEVVRDVVDPNIAELDRKLKSIVNTRSFRISGASVGTVSMAYTAAAGAGSISSVAALFGAGAVGLLSNEYAAYRKEIYELRENPFYFLWKCRKTKKGIKSYLNR